MPLLKEIELLGTRLIVWDLLESDHEIANALHCLDKTNGLNFIERHFRLTLGWQFVLQSILGQQYLGVYKDVHGKPFLLGADMQLSVAHTKQIVVCALHQSKRIGVDIEAFSGKISRVKHKFMSTLELKNHENEFDLTQIWCAKEAMFKLNGERGVSFKQDIRVQQFSTTSGEIFLRDGLLAQYASVVLDDLMLVVAIEG
jgi:4'-phosphopantetheinyl transferase